MENKTVLSSMSINNPNIEPVGYINFSYIKTRIAVYENISWFKSKMIKLFFGGIYTKI